MGSNLYYAIILGEVIFTTVVLLCFSNVAYSHVKLTKSLINIVIILFFILISRDIFSTFSTYNTFLTVFLPSLCWGQKISKTVWMLKKISTKSQENKMYCQIHFLPLVAKSSVINNYLTSLIISETVKLRNSWSAIMAYRLCLAMLCLYACLNVSTPMLFLSRHFGNLFLHYLPIITTDLLFSSINPNILWFLSNVLLCLQFLKLPSAPRTGYNKQKRLLYTL